MLNKAANLHLRSSLNTMRLEKSGAAKDKQLHKSDQPLEDINNLSAPQRLPTQEPMSFAQQGLLSIQPLLPLLHRQSL